MNLLREVGSSVILFIGAFFSSLCSQGEDLLGDVDSESITESVAAEDREQDDASVGFQPP